MMRNSSRRRNIRWFFHDEHEEQQLRVGPRHDMTHAESLATISITIVIIG